MAFTLICHACGQKLTLFDLDVKKRKGSIRCTRCGAKISYNLDRRSIQESGFRAEKEIPFDSGAKSRLINQMKRKEMRRNVAKEQSAALVMQESSTPPAHNFGDSPFSRKAGFARFDIKTGTILQDAKKTSPPAEGKISFQKENPPPASSASSGTSPSVTGKTIKPKEPAFIPSPRSTGISRRRTVLRPPQKPQALLKPKIQISKIQSFWQKIKNFFRHR